MRSRAMPAETVIAYWLLPAAPAREFFRAAIQRLAEAYAAPVFQPHLTLLVGRNDDAEARRILERPPSGPILLPVIGLGFTSKFTQTLFVRFAPTPALSATRQALGISAAAGVGPSEPHLSVLYRRIGASEQARLARELKIPLTEVIFDTLAAVRCRLPVEAVADVESWEWLGSCRLGGRAG